MNRRLINWLGLTGILALLGQEHLQDVIVQ